MSKNTEKQFSCCKLQLDQKLTLVSINAINHNTYSYKVYIVYPDVPAEMSTLKRMNVPKHTHTQPVKPKDYVSGWCVLTSGHPSLH